MLIAFVIVGWFVCGIAGERLDRAIERAHPTSYGVMPVYWIMLGPCYLLFVICWAVYIAARNREKGGGNG